MRRAARIVGTVAIGLGVGLCGWIYWYGFATDQAATAAQQQLRVEWSGRHRFDTAERNPNVAEVVTEPVPLSHGVAELRFPQRVATDPLIVLDGVEPTVLAAAPGAYPGSEPPGEPGNFAVAGHRTTHGAPFADVERLRRGDLITVTDRAGIQWPYRVVELRVVEPSDVKVVDDDPLGTGQPTLTLTTCNPRYSAAERLIVHAVLDETRGR